MRSDSQDYTILIADDDRLSRQTLREIVASDGYQACEAASGEEAIEIVQRQPIHLALFDLHMPRLTGLEAIEIIHHVNPPLPCILITGDADEDVLRQAFEARVFSVLPKPVSKPMVLTVVMRALLRAYGSLPHDEPHDLGDSKFFERGTSIGENE